MLRFKKRLTLKTMLLVALIATTSCASTKPTIPITETVNPVCVVWKTISYSAKSDSTETVRQIISDNAARDQVCGK